MSEQPEALRLADALENLESTGWGLAITEYSEKQANLAAAELRRLHSVNAELLEALKKRADVDFAYAKLLVADIEADTFQLLLDEIDDAEYAAKALSSATIAKAQE